MSFRITHNGFLYRIEKSHDRESLLGFKLGTNWFPLTAFDYYNIVPCYHETLEGAQKAIEHLSKGGLWDFKPINDTIYAELKD